MRGPQLVGRTHGENALTDPGDRRRGYAAKAFFSYPSKPFIGTKKPCYGLASKEGRHLKSEYTVAYRITSECDKMPRTFMSALRIFMQTPLS
jgi:hypothetical protein